jgi:murein DD-endopeptidase MepM/ murein hydrolase activator NlpD
MNYPTQNVPLFIIVGLVVLTPLRPMCQFNTIGVVSSARHETSKQSFSDLNYLMFSKILSNLKGKYEMKSIPLHAPLKSLFITSYNGWRTHPIIGKCMFHRGIDLRANYEPVYAIMDGIVLESGYNQRSGMYIRLFHYSKVSSSYAHLSTTRVKKGQLVKVGEIIGISGNSGASNAPHLHFRIDVE